MKSSGWLSCVLVAAAVHPAMAQERDAVLVLDARNESVAYLVKADRAPLGGPPPSFTDSNARADFLVQGKRAELRVYNRKFLSDYTITIDAVTTLTGVPIRGLPEAENLTIGAPTFAVPPPSKGGLETVTQRTAGDILTLLLDETQATKPVADLNADYEELKREQAQITKDLGAFNQNYGTVYGGPTPTPCLDFGKISGAPDAQSLISCLAGELRRVNTGFPPPPRPTDEQHFREVVVEVQDLILAVKTFSGVIANANLLQSAQVLDAEVTQHEKNYITFQQNVQSAVDAVDLLLAMDSTLAKYGYQTIYLRTARRLADLKATLNKSLKPPLDDAEIDQLLKSYLTLIEGRRLQVEHTANELRTRAGVVRNAVVDPDEPSGLRDQTNDAKGKVGVDLPRILDKINEQQGRLLARVNEIYDHSEVPEALPKQIDISGHSGNLIVYYTIRRIENFTRFVVAPVQNPSAATTAAAQGTPLPPPAGTTTPTPSAAPTSASAAASPSPAPAPGSAASAEPTGTVVAHGTFYVHDLYRANVVAAFAYSWAKDQNIVKQPQPTACGGSTAVPDENCFSPLLNNSSPQLDLILGVDYYFQRRDTFYDLRITDTPKRSKKDWLLQSTGIMGAVSATKANDWFLGLFFEPWTGIQFGGGANFTSEGRLQKNFQFGTPVDITGDFPTQDARVTKPFISAGLDLGLFRKIFGKLTGIGTSATATQGK